MQLTLTLKMITAQVIKTSFALNNSPIHNYDQPDNHVPPSYKITPGFKPFTEKKKGETSLSAKITTLLKQFP